MDFFTRRTEEYFTSQEKLSAQVPEVFGKSCHFIMRDWKPNLTIVWFDGQLFGPVAYSVYTI